MPWRGSRRTASLRRRRCVKHSTITCNPRKRSSWRTRSRARSSSSCGACVTRAIFRRSPSRSARSTCITAGTTQNISDVANTILKDYSLTNKLLRVVNSVHYRQVGGGDISTVSRAVVVLGLDAVRSIAITVMLFDHLQNKSLASQLKEEFLRANLAGALARDLAAESLARGEAEQAFVCSMFFHLGRLLSQYYFPEEYAEIRRLMAYKNASEEHAAQEVLGVSYEDIGQAIAHSWGFPRLI
ncbi:MAG TPA: HDOD domain-containing protein, partial [Accumulibacter sp.]|nr:HDOD domain-containing protein [Accumulibacter sp.]